MSRDPNPGELDLMWRDCQDSHAVNVLLAERQRIEEKLRALGLSFWPAKAVWVSRTTGERFEDYVGVRGFRDGKGNILSARLEFISKATKFFHVTSVQLIATMEPEACSDDAAYKKASQRLRQDRATLRRHKIFVR